MNKNFIGINITVVCLFNLYAGISACAQPNQMTCEQLVQEYTPQNSPEATYRLELKLLSQGIYCYDLPIFDSAWRRRGNTMSHSPNNKQTAQMFNKPFKTYIDGNYAIVYYPQNKELGPSFLYRGADGWILDRTMVIEKIHYGNEWLADEGNYPYLSLLKKVFNLEKGQSNRGVMVYRLKNH